MQLIVFVLFIMVATSFYAIYEEYMPHKVDIKPIYTCSRCGSDLTHSTQKPGLSILELNCEKCNDWVMDFRTSYKTLKVNTDIRSVKA